MSTKTHSQLLFRNISKGKHKLCVVFLSPPPYLLSFLPYFQQSSLLFVLHCWRQFIWLCFSLKNVNSLQGDGKTDAISELQHDCSPLIHEWRRSSTCILHRDVAQWVTFFWPRKQPPRAKPCLMPHLVFFPLLCCYWPPVRS